MYTTDNCYVIGMPLITGEWRFDVTGKNLDGGGFRVRFMTDKICVTEYAFKSNTNDEKYENKIFKEVIRGLVNKNKLPVYFDANVVSDQTRVCLLEMGAKEVKENDNVWADANAKEVDVIKLEVPKEKKKQ